MGLALRKEKHYTYADYLQWPDETRYELIDGEAFLMSPAPLVEHQEVAGEVYYQLRNQLDAILVATPAVRWTLTTSRRTPADTEPALLALRERGVDVRPVRDTPPGWAMEQVARSAQAWVTEDSVSMVYESLTAGAATGLLAVPRLGETRITAGVANLQREGFVTPFADWQRTGRLSTPPERLAEAERVAEAVLARFGA